MWRDTLLSVASDRRIIRRYLSLQSRSDVAEAVVNLGLLDLKQNRLAEAQQAEALAPELLMPHEALSDLYAANHQMAEAMREYATAMQLYKTVYADYGNFVPPPKDPSAPPQPGP